MQNLTNSHSGFSSKNVLPDPCTKFIEAKKTRQITCTLFARPSECLGFRSTTEWFELPRASSRRRARRPYSARRLASAQWSGLIKIVQKIRFILNGQFTPQPMRFQPLIYRYQLTLSQPEEGRLCPTKW